VSFESSKRKKIVWLTNLPAPYRYPIWNNLSKYYELRVIFVLREVNWRNWHLPQENLFTSIKLSKYFIRFGEFEFVPGITGLRKITQDANLIVITGWEYPLYIITLFYSKLKKIPVFIFYESTEKSHRFNGFFIRNIRNKIFSMADHIFTSGIASSTAVKSMGIDVSKITTLFNPVDVEWFSKNSDRLIDQSPGHKFIFVGQLIERKNVGTLLFAFSEICNLNDTLTIVGEGKLLEYLTNYASILGIKEKVKFVGHIDQEHLAHEYAKANTLVLPSKNEVWGLVVNEALACGLHVVVSDKAGVSDLVHNMRGAYIAKTDINSLKFALEESRRDWCGAINKPEILQFTPAKFASALKEAINKFIE
jgi:glycosyltransferase involved in cell wall biosynthesis